MKTVIYYVGVGICALFLAWIFVSWIDVIIHNGMRDYIYANWNVFKLLIGG